MSEFPLTQRANVNEAASIHCLVDGDKPLNVSWKRNGLEIEADGQFSVSIPFLAGPLPTLMALESDKRLNFALRMMTMATLEKSFFSGSHVCTFNPFCWPPYLPESAAQGNTSSPLLDTLQVYIWIFLATTFF